MNLTLDNSQRPDACPLCDGTGWKPVTQGNISRVTRCDCRLLARSQSLLDAARIPKRYEHCELANFDHVHTRGSLFKASAAACKFAEEYPLDTIGLLFVGETGVGKTHLAVGIIKRLTQIKNIPCLFADYRELLKEIQNSYNPSVQTTELSLLRPIFEAEVLVLDELGAVKPTEWVWDTVSLILNTRYNQNRTTIITTNFPNALAHNTEGDNTEFGRARRAASKETLGDRIGDRMLSRLQDMCHVVEVQGDDHRRKNADLRKRKGGAGFD